ncbi:MAG: glucose-1-phosphate adenylyltransferase [Simkaniaceae bacterium]|nr:glucose-1-phosphate adenylyltransferase [Simkaniaceae bacterium]
MQKRIKVSANEELLSQSAAVVILAGGQGTRLFPLTQTRCKPDVSFAGRYRLIDVPISNSINSHIPNIFVISQFFASALNRHITETFHPGSLTFERIELLSPEETAVDKLWYQGTADAVRKNMQHLLKLPVDYFIILSGDQLYNMDLIDMLCFAKEKDADLTIATLPCSRHDAPRMGVMQTDENLYIKEFYEKPTEEAILDKFRNENTGDPERPYLASMGIYIFKREVLASLVQEDNRDDFGKHIIPTQIYNHGKTAAYIYEGYWEDIGTIKSFYEANLSLTTNENGLDLYNETCPIYAQAINLPAARMNDSKISQSIICDGSVVDADEVIHSLIGMRTVIGKGTKVHDTIVMGNSYYEPPKLSNLNHPPRYGIGSNCLIKKTIVDEHTLIDDDVHLTNEQNLTNYDSPHLYVRDGIIIIPSGTHLQKGFRF